MCAATHSGEGEIGCSQRRGVARGCEVAHNSPHPVDLNPQLPYSRSRVSIVWSKTSILANRVFFNVYARFYPWLYKGVPDHEY